MQNLSETRNDKQQLNTNEQLLICLFANQREKEVEMPG